MSDDVRQVLRQYVLEEFLPGQAPDELRDDTPLMTGGILDSIATVKLVDFLEKRYGVRFEAHEMDVDHMENVGLIAGLVENKRAGR